MKKARSIGRLTSCIHRFTTSHIHNELEKYDIGSGQTLFLMRLYHGDGINQESLARDLKTDKATSTRAIKKLERARYVRREIDDADKRAYKIYLTEKAEKMRPVVRGILKDWTNHLLTGFSEGEKEKLFDFLERIVENAVAKRQPRSDGHG